MGYIYTGENGITLREILKYYNNQDFELIECRCKWEDNDELFGFCQYINGELKPLDYGIYSLDYKYIEWKKEDDRLVIWDSGRYSEVWEFS